MFTGTSTSPTFLPTSARHRTQVYRALGRTPREEWGSVGTYTGVWYSEGASRQVGVEGRSHVRVPPGATTHEVGGREGFGTQSRSQVRVGTTLRSALN